MKKFMTDEYIKGQINRVDALLGEAKAGKARRYLRELIVKSTPLKFKKFRNSFAQISERFPSGHREMLMKNIEERIAEIEQEEKRRAKEKAIEREEKRRAKEKAQNSLRYVQIKSDSLASESEKDYGPGKCRYCGRPAMYASDVCYKHSRE